MLRTFVVRGLLALGITLGVFAALPAQVQAGAKAIEKRALRGADKKLKKQEKGLERKLKRDKRQDAASRRFEKALGGKKKGGTKKK